MKLPKSLKKRQLLALALPFAAMLMMIGINVLQLTSATEYRLKIMGYDPRDILRGHYLIFRYDWPEETEASPFQSRRYTPTYYACLTGDPKKPSVSFKKREKNQTLKDCIDKIAVTGARGQPNQALRQYYIPEAYAKEIERRLIGNKNIFEVGLVPQPNGNGKLKMLYIDGIPLPKFLRQLPPTQ